MQQTTPVDANSLTTVIGANSADPFPMLERSWDVFSGKGIRTVFLSIGNSKSVAADLDIAEGLGCPINHVALNEAEFKAWSEVSAILKERKREETAQPFSAGAETKWILPKNVRRQAFLPWWSNGTVDLSGGPVETQAVGRFMESICSTMKVKDNVVRIDVLKIDTVAAAPGLERGILGAVLNAGFRPAVVLVHWSQSPNVGLATTVAAGNLQNCGYRLMSKVDNKFLYYFTDDDMYQLCSWEETSCQNPLMHEIISAAKDSILSVKTRGDSNVPDSSTEVSSGGKA
jgi:hypothetical protein